MRLLLPVLLVGACAIPPDPDAPDTDQGVDTDTIVDTDPVADTDPVVDTDPDDTDPDDTGPDTGPDTDPAADTDVAADTDPGDTGLDTDPGHTGDTGLSADTDVCDPPLPDVCAPGETLVCGGACVPGFLATPSSDPQHDPRADCLAFAQGELPARGAPTPGYFGVRAWLADTSPSQVPLLRNCWGEAESNPRTYANGTCDARWNCEVGLWDGGDCTAQPSVLGTSKTVRTAADVADLQSVTELDTLEIDGRTMTTAAFPNLRRLHHLKVWGNGLTSLSLPALTTIEGRLSLQGMPDLVSFSAPSLTSIGGDWWRTANVQGEAVHVDDLDSLTTLDLHSLAHVGAGLRLLHLPKLVQVDLPVLEQVMGGLYLQHLDKTQRVTVPALTHVGSHLQVRALPRLTQVDLPALSTVGGGLTLRELTTLTTVTAPVLRRAATVIVRESYAVDRLSMPSLEHVAGSMRGSARTVEVGHLRHVGDTLALSVRGTAAADLCALEDAKVVDLTLGGGTPRVELTAWHGDADSLNLRVQYPWAPLVLRAPRIERLGQLRLDGVTRAELGALNHVDTDLILNGLRTLEAPLLTEVDSLCVTGLRGATTSLPSIRVAQQVFAILGGDLQLPALERTGWLDAEHWDQVSLPSLTEIGRGQDHAACDLHGSAFANEVDAAQVDLSGLARVQKLYLTVRSPLSLPRLESATSLNVSFAAGLDAPLLSSVRSLTLWAVTPPVLTPQLTTLDSLFLYAPTGSGAGVYELPNLRTIGTFELRADRWDEVRLPDLQRIETELTTPFVTNVRALSMPSLVYLKSARLPALQVIDLSALVEAEELRIGQNFKECETLLTGAQPRWPTPMDLRLDALTTVGVFDVMHTRAAVTLKFPKLSTIHGRYRLIDLPDLTRVELPAITVIPDDVWINLRNLPALTRANLPNAREVGRLAFWNTGLTTIDYPNLRVFHDRISARENTALRTIRYANVTSAGGVDIGDNPLLDTLDLPSLTQVDGDVTIDFNTSLPTCDITPLVASWQVSGTTEVFANEACVP